MKANNWMWIIGLMSLLGCQDDSVVPGYVHFTEWEFQAEPGEGTSRQKIQSAHIFVDGQSIGVYQLPTTIPVIGGEDTEIFAFPMVKRNGMKELDEIHPYHRPHEQLLDIRADQDDTVRLKTGYSENVDFIVIEDFESTTQFNDDIDGDPLTKLERQTTVVYEGNASGRATVSADNPILEMGFDTLVSNTQGRGTYWVELDYKTNITFVMGVRKFIRGIEFKDYDAAILPNEEWNKIYFDLTDLFTVDNSGLYQLAVVCLHTADTEVENGEIFVDNIKLLRRE